jgi:hypothetical protein
MGKYMKTSAESIIEDGESITSALDELAKHLPHFKQTYLDSSELDSIGLRWNKKRKVV